MPGYIHHVEWCVSDLKAQVTSLVSHYGFNIIGRRFVQVQPCWNVEQVIVQSGATVFVLTQKLRRTSQNVQGKQQKLVFRRILKFLQFLNFPTIMHHLAVHQVARSKQFLNSGRSFLKAPWPRRTN
jgi:hypothetical protein